MTGPPAGELLREDVSGTFRIRRCDISIAVRPDMQTARYVYSYQIERTGPGNDEWRDVFAYPQREVAVEYVRTGLSSADSSDHGLAYQLLALNTPNKNASLLIEFDRPLSVGDKYEFHYACVTRIENLTNVSSLGGTGGLWFWCAYEYPVDTINATVSVPRRVRITATHPGSVATDAGRKFSASSLMPRDFVLALLTYEKRVMGIPVRYARLADRTVVFALGVLSSLVASAVWLFAQ